MFSLSSEQPTCSNKGCGVYKIVNKINGKMYIGSSSKIYSRFIAHKHSLRKNIHNAKYLQNAWNKYGEENFDFTPILLCDIEWLALYEDLLIKSVGLDKLYNIRLHVTSNRGLKMSEDVKKRMSESHQRYIDNNPEYRKKLSEYSRVTWDNPELVEQIRLKKTGLKRTQEFKDGQSKRSKEFWQKLKVSNPEEYMNRVGNFRKRRGSGTKDPKTGRYIKNV